MISRNIAVHSGTTWNVEAGTSLWTARMWGFTAWQRANSPSIPALPAELRLLGPRPLVAPNLQQTNSTADQSAVGTVWPAWPFKIPRYAVNTGKQLDFWAKVRQEGLRYSLIIEHLAIEFLKSSNREFQNVDRGTKNSISGIKILEQRKSSLDCRSEIQLPAWLGTQTRQKAKAHLEKRECARSFSSDGSRSMRETSTIGRDEAERTEMCGARYTHQERRQAVRAGHVAG